MPNIRPKVQRKQKAVKDDRTSLHTFCAHMALPEAALDGLHKFFLLGEVDINARTSYYNQVLTNMTALDFIPYDVSFLPVAAFLVSRGARTGHEATAWSAYVKQCKLRMLLAHPQMWMPTDIARRVGDVLGFSLSDIVDVRRHYGFQKAHVLTFDAMYQVGRPLLYDCLYTCTLGHRWISSAALWRSIDSYAADVLAAQRRRMEEQEYYIHMQARGGMVHNFSGLGVDYGLE